MLNRHRRLLAYNNKERRSRPRSSRLALSSSKSADDCAGGSRSLRNPLLIKRLALSSSKSAHDCAGGSRSLRNPLLIKRLALSSSKSGHDCAGGSRSLRNPLLIKPSRAVIIEIRPRLCRRHNNHPETPGSLRRGRGQLTHDESRSDDVVVSDVSYGKIQIELFCILYANS